MNNKEEVFKTIDKLIEHSQKCRPNETGHGVVIGLAKSLKAMLEEPNEMIEELHPDTKNLLKVCFEELRLKLINNQKKYGWSNEWITCDWEQECREEMMKHIKKGDPRDVAIYAMFMIYRGWSTVEESKELSIDEELVNEFEKYLEFFLAEDNRIRGLAETMAKIAQQYANGKLEELIFALEKYNKCLANELNDVVSVASVHVWRSKRFEECKLLRQQISEIKDKITSLKQQL